MSAFDWLADWREPLRRLLRNESGAMFAEYALMLAILCCCGACAAYFLGDAISDAMTDIAGLLSKEWEQVTSDRLIAA